MHKLDTFERFMGLTGLVVLLLASMLWNPTPVVGQGPEDRPTIQPPNVTPQPGPPGKQLPSLHGTVFNWGFRNEPNVLVRVSGAGWHLDALSDATGYYRFEQLGDEVVWLSVSPPEGSNAKPLTIDVAVRPITGDETVVNLGVYEGEEPLPLPVVHKMEVSPAQVGPGGQVTFTVHLKNNLDTPISHAWLTDYLPTGLSFVGANSDHGPVGYADGLVVADLDTILPGVEAEVTIVAQVDPDGEALQELTNRSSLIYRESVATQATVTVAVSEEPLTETVEVASDESSFVLPVTGIGLPLAAVGLAAILLIVRRLRTRLARQ